MKASIFVATLALPTVLIFGPNSAEAQGNRGWGQSCYINSDCSSGMCMQPPPGCASELCPTAQCLGNSTTVTIQTFYGQFLTAVIGGGLSGSDAAINTNRTVQSTWETFNCKFTSPRIVTFQTTNGQFVTAVNGGGIGGPNANPYEIHTDARQAQTWEQFTILTDNENHCALKTSNGSFVTAVNGGGWGNNDQANKFPIHTNAAQAGIWETFTLNGN